MAECKDFIEAVDLFLKGPNIARMKRLAAIATKHTGNEYLLDGTDLLTIDGKLEYLRERGWTVAIHNDYQLGPQRFSFWLFTHKKSGRFLKEEDKMDAKALDRIVKHVQMEQRHTTELEMMVNNSREEER